jgi:hypothetical protein
VQTIAILELDVIPASLDISKSKLRVKMSSKQGSLFVRSAQRSVKIVNYIEIIAQNALNITSWSERNASSPTST